MGFWDGLKAAGSAAAATVTKGLQSAWSATADVASALQDKADTAKTLYAVAEIALKKKDEQILNPEFTKLLQEKLNSKIKTFENKRQAIITALQSDPNNRELNHRLKVLQFSIELYQSLIRVCAELQHLTLKEAAIIGMRTFLEEGSTERKIAETVIRTVWKDTDHLGTIIQKKQAILDCFKPLLESGRGLLESILKESDLSQTEQQNLMNFIFDKDPSFEPSQHELLKQHRQKQMLTFLNIEKSTWNPADYTLNHFENATEETIEALLKDYFALPKNAEDIQNKKGYAYRLFVLAQSLEKEISDLKNSSPLERLKFFMANAMLPIEATCRVLVPSTESEATDVLKDTAGIASDVLGAVLGVWPELHVAYNELTEKKEPVQARTKEDIEKNPIPLLSPHIWEIVREIKATKTDVLGVARDVISRMEKMTPEIVTVFSVNVAHVKQLFASMFSSWDKNPAIKKTAGDLQVAPLISLRTLFTDNEQKNILEFIEATQATFSARLNCTQFKPIVKKQDGTFEEPIPVDDNKIYASVKTLFDALSKEVDKDKKPLFPFGSIPWEAKHVLDNVQHDTNTLMEEAEKLRSEIIVCFSKKDEAKIQELNRRLKKLQNDTNIVSFYHPDGFGPITHSYLELLKGIYEKYTNTADPVLKELLSVELSALLPMFEHLMKYEKFLTMFSPPATEHDLKQTAEKQHGFILNLIVSIGKGESLPYLKQKLFEFVQSSLPIADNPLDQLRQIRLLEEMRALLGVSMDVRAFEAVEVESIHISYDKLNEELTALSSEKHPAKAFVGSLKNVERYLMGRAKETGKHVLGYSAKDYYKRRESFARVLQEFSEIKPESFEHFTRKMIDIVKRERSLFKRWQKPAKDAGFFERILNFFKNLRNLFRRPPQYAYYLRALEKSIQNMKKTQGEMKPEQQQEIYQFVEVQCRQLAMFHHSLRDKTSPFRSIVLQDTMETSTEMVVKNGKYAFSTEPMKPDEIQVFAYDKASTWLHQWGMPKTSDAFIDLERQQAEQVCPSTRKTRPNKK